MSPNAKRSPGQGAPSDQPGWHDQTEVYSIERARPLRSQHTSVERASIEMLVKALLGDGPFKIDTGDEFALSYFVCPKCRYQDHNQPCARRVSEVRWICSHCGADSTRAELERLVREHWPSSERLRRLIEDVR